MEIYVGQLDFAKFSCALCKDVTVAGRDELFHIMEKGGFVICDKCGAPAQFFGRPGRVDWEFQETPRPLAAVEFLELELGVFMWCRQKREASPSFVRKRMREAELKRGERP